MIITDGLRLRQILINLLGNAMKFTNKGDIFLNVTLVADLGDSLELNFEVADTGIGIPKKMLSSLFKPFTQLDSSTTRRHGGTGLGLAITKRLVKLLGGEIKVESTEGTGTKFNFNIKCDVVKRDRQHSVKFPDIAKKHVLIVDDNNACLSALKQQLELWNLQATITTSGAEALMLLENSETYDVVITDIQMPVMDGLELGKRVKNLYPQIQVVLLSFLGDDSWKKVPELFVSVLNKPIKQRQLSAVLQTALKHQQSTEIHDYKLAPALSADFAKDYPLNILVAEDNLVIQMLVMRILNKLGYAPELANNGLEVLELLADKTFDIILMDIQMPGMDGLEATRKIREKTGIGQPYIIAMTANAMPKDRQDCYSAGMNNYLSKPIKFDLLLIALQESFNAQKTGPGDITLQGL
jgi:CheY-like chemotaxis protein